jgi:hypothetical protein
MTDQILHFDGPARYRIRVQGYLEPSWSGSLGGMSITGSTLADPKPVTTLCGWLIDQAALLGVLNSLYNSLHAPLLSVECLSVDPPGSDLMKE